MQDAKQLFLDKHPHMDGRLVYFSEHYDKWISSLPSGLVPIVLNMIEHFDYYSQQQVNILLKQLYTTFKANYQLNNEDVLLTYLTNFKGRINSSIDYFTEYRRINEIDKGFSTDNIKNISDKDWSRIEHIVIVDDCCGTGGSLETYIKHSERDFSCKCLYYLVVHSLEQSKAKIESIQEKYHVKVYLISINNRIKAFSLIDSDDPIKDKDALCKASKTMKISEDYCLGKEESQALVAFHNNTPNNTIGLFWYDTDLNTSVFPRKPAKEPSWRKRPTPNQMHFEREERKRQNYQAVKNSG